MLYISGIRKSFGGRAVLGAVTLRVEAGEYVAIVGESGTGAAPAVVMNAVNDALRPFGARVAAQPITPESVLIALGKI